MEVVKRFISVKKNICLYIKMNTFVLFTAEAWKKMM